MSPPTVVLERILLASASPRRLELLQSLGFMVRVEPSGYGEPDDPAVTPRDLAIRHAAAKAQELRERFPDEVVVAADTVVDVDGRALGKPHDAGEASAMLRALSGREHQVHTAYAIALPGQAELFEDAASTKVRFYPLDDDEIAAYVASGEPMDKAGAYGIQGRAASLVAAIDGDFYTVMGFPLARFVRALRRLGFALPMAKKTSNE
jgi:septum formation protein